MQVVSATVESMDFYCPVSGERVISEEFGYAPSKATKGFWFNEDPFRPSILDDGLLVAWNEWLTSVDQDDELVGAIDLLEDHAAENWAVFGLHTRGMPGDTVWVVIDLAGHDE